MALHQITKEADAKRKFHYKLKSFDQLFQEIERLEEREAILAKTLVRIMELAKACSVTADSVSYDKDLAENLGEIIQDLLDEMAKMPSKSKGYTMIENMGVDFYEELRKNILEDEENE